MVVLNEPTVGDTVAEPMLDEQIAPKIFPLPSLVPVAEIAVIVSVGRELFCYDVAGKRWSWTLSLNHTISGLPTEDFYQVSKSCIVSRKNILTAFRTNSRSALLLLAKPKDHYALVSYRENTIFGLWYKLRIISAKRSDFKNIK